MFPYFVKEGHRQILTLDILKDENMHQNIEYKYVNDQSLQLN